MKVRATSQGYHDMKIRNEGDEFHLKSPEEYSENWMEPVDGEAPQGKKNKPGKKAKEIHAEALEDTLSKQNKNLDNKDVI